MRISASQVLAIAEPAEFVVSLEEIQRERRQGPIRQEQVNRIAKEHTLQAAKATILRYARHRHKEYPQYEGQWEGEEWKLYRVRQTVVTKAGEAFREGDWVLVKRGPAFWGTVWNDHVTAYSVRNGINTSVWISDVERIGR